MHVKRHVGRPVAARSVCRAEMPVAREPYGISLRPYPDGSRDPRWAPAGRSTRSCTCLPPVGHDGPERRIGRPQAPTEQTRHYSGTKRCHTGKNVLLINAALTSLFLSPIYPGSTHDQRMADATPSPVPAGSRWLQDLGFLACTLDQVAIIRPSRQPRGRHLRRAPKAVNRRIARRRVRIEPVNSSVKRCRIVHATSRLRKAGVHDRVMDVCCALHHVRVRLTPWQPMVSAERPMPIHPPVTVAFAPCRLLVHATQSLWQRPEDAWILSA
jgi:hypothetical protein